MSRVVGIGIQDFSQIITENYFYMEKGIEKHHIHKYGFAFKGKTVLIDKK